MSNDLNYSDTITSAKPTVISAAIPVSFWTLSDLKPGQSELRNKFSMARIPIPLLENPGKAGADIFNQ